MNRKKIGILLTCLVTLLLLWAVNRDLMHFEETFVYRRTFVPEEDGKGDQIPLPLPQRDRWGRYKLFSESISLKPGSYLLEVTGLAESRGAGIFLIDQHDEKVYTSDFVGKDPAYTFDLDHAASVRFGVSYDPQYGTPLVLEKIRFSADGILYREALFRHIKENVCILLAAGVVLLWLCFRPRVKKVFPFLSDPSEKNGLLLILLLTIASCVPLLFRNSYIQGDDLGFHLGRIQGIADSLKSGYFPPKIQLGWLENYGYGAGFFYPDIFLIIPAVFCVLGFSTTAAYKIFLGLCTFFSLFSIQKSVKAISNSSEAANYAAILYAFAAYRLIDVYYRAALGEVQTFVFLPLIVWGICEIFTGHTERWKIFAFGFFGVISSHIISVALAGLFTGAFVLFSIPWWARKKEIWFAFIKSILLVFGLSAFFWMPFIEQYLTTRLKINQIIRDPVQQVWRISHPISFTKMKSLFSFSTDWQLVNGAWVVYPGLMILLIPLLRILFLHKQSQKMKIADILTLVGFVALFSCTDVFPWRWKVFENLLMRIRLSWRSMMIVTTTLCMSCGIYLEKMIKTKKVLYGCLVTICSVVIAFPILNQSVIELRRTVDDDYYDNMYSDPYMGGEYKPVAFTHEIAARYKDSVLVKDDDGTARVSKADRSGLEVAFDFDSSLPHDSLAFIVPLIKYTGYQAELTDGAETYSLDIQTDEKGRVVVDVGSAEKGSVRVHYEKTPVQVTSEIITVLSLCVCFLPFVKKKVFRKEILSEE